MDTMTYNEDFGQLVLNLKIGLSFVEATIARFHKHMFLRIKDPAATPRLKIAKCHP